MCQLDITCLHSITFNTYLYTFSLLILIELIGIWMWGIFKSPFIQSSLLNYTFLKNFSNITLNR